MSKSKQQNITATVKREPFEEFMNAVTPIVSEAKLHFGPDGMEIKAVDAVNVAMVHAELYPSAYTEEPESGDVVGIATKTVADAAPSNYDLNIEYDADRRKMVLSSGVYWHEYTAMDPDKIRTEPDLPNMDLTFRGTIEGDRLTDAVEWFHHFGRHVRTGYDPVEERFWMECIEKDGASTGTDERGLSIDSDELVEVSEHGNADSHFLLDYFSDIMSGVPEGRDVEMYIGEEFPMNISYEFEHGAVEYMLAPWIA